MSDLHFIYSCFIFAVGKQQLCLSTTVGPSLQWSGILLTAVFLLLQERTIKYKTVLVPVVLLKTCPFY